MDQTIPEVRGLQLDKAGVSAIGQPASNCIIARDGSCQLIIA